MIPVLETARLILRAPVMADFDVYAPVLMSDRAQYIHGPYTREQAFREFSTAAGSWVLNGFGPWAITLREGGAFCGLVTLQHPVYFPEREMGWILLEDFEGQGIAFEAAGAARDHAFGAFGWDTLVSYIAEGNDRSIRLAEKLGAVRDPAAQAPGGCPLVYRHQPRAGAA